MIKKIQVDTRGAVTSMEEGTKEVDEGIKLADKVGSSLHEIVGISQKVTDMVAIEVADKPGGLADILVTLEMGGCVPGGGLGFPVLADLVAGLSTAEIGGLPGDYVLQDGDPVIVDVVPRLAGYWGDNAGTHFVGEPSQALRKIYQLVRETLQLGVGAVRPGLRACDLDEMLRAAIGQQGYPVYPHHSGHGIGTSYHEEPRIVPYNTATLEPGMVIALEPGIYLPEIGGVRLEDVVLVTEGGCELLTFHLVA